MNDFAQNVRSRREFLGWSQQQLADKSGVSQTTIDKIERGITKNSRYMVYISKALGLKLDDATKDIDAAVPMKYGYPEEVINKFLTHPSIPLLASETEVTAQYATPDIRKRAFLIGGRHIDTISSALVPGDEGKAYAIYIANSYMSPELEEGDTAVVDPRASLIRGSTCVFGYRGELVRIIGRLERAQEGAWEIEILCPSEKIVLPKSDWILAHRIVAKLYRK